MAKMNAVLIENEYRTERLLRNRFDALHDRGQDFAQRGVGCNQTEDAKLLEQQKLRVFALDDVTFFGDQKRDLTPYVFPPDSFN